MHHILLKQLQSVCWATCYVQCCSKQTLYDVYVFYWYSDECFLQLTAPPLCGRLLCLDLVLKNDGRFRWALTVNLNRGRGADKRTGLCRACYCSYISLDPIYSISYLPLCRLPFLCHSTSPSLPLRKSKMLLQNFSRRRETATSRYEQRTSLTVHKLF